MLKIKQKLKLKFYKNMCGVEYFRKARLSNGGCLIRHRACPMSVVHPNTSANVLTGLPREMVCVKRKQDCYRTKSS